MARRWIWGEIKVNHFMKIERRHTSLSGLPKDLGTMLEPHPKQGTTAGEQRFVPTF
jgi:hypothetical protein